MIQSNIYWILSNINQAIYTLDTNCMPYIMILAQVVITRPLIVACIHGLPDHTGSAIDYFITRFNRSYHGFIHGLTNSRVH